MILEQGHLYHIFNQGNNRQKIFYNRENYLFFIKKIETYISPYTDILAWCLMPNHFHLMVYVNRIELKFVEESGNATSSHAPRDSRSTTSSRTTTLNKSIGIMLTSYTRAINNQENRSGALFKPHTKAECLTKSEGITPSFFNTHHGTIINIPHPENEYPRICFNYIRNNPVKANLVKHPEDWEFSSYQDLFGLREGKLINKARAKEFGLL